MRKEVVKGFFFRNHSSTHRQNPAFVLTEHFRQGALLDCSIPGLSIERKYFSEGHSRLPLNFAVQLDEGDAQLQCQFRSQSRFAGSSQPNQGDTLAARALPWAEVAHQAKDHIRKAMIRESFKESPDHLFFGGLFRFRRK